MWFDHVQLHSHRDQLSLPVASWLHGFKPRLIELDFMDNDVLEHPCPQKPVRVPREFGDERYLLLNPDVRATNMESSSALSASRRGGRSPFPVKVIATLPSPNRI